MSGFYFGFVDFVSIFVLASYLYIFFELQDIIFYRVIFSSYDYSLTNSRSEFQRKDGMFVLNIFLIS